MKSKITLITTITILCTLILSMGIIAQIQAAPITGPAPLTVNFTLDENASSYNWDFTSDNTTDSTNAAPTFTFENAGTYITTVQADNSTFNTTITVIEPVTNVNASVNTTTSNATNTTNTTTEQPKPTEITIAATASPESGNIPLTVQFTSITAAPNPIYAWDFDGDNKTDSTNQNPSYTYDKGGIYNATVTVTSNQQTVTKIIPISTSQYNSNLVLLSYFPKNVKSGENHITFIIQNNGSTTVNSIGSKVVAQGLQYASSSNIDELRPQDQDSVTAVVNVIQTNGTMNGIVKIVDKTFPVTFEISAQATYDKDDITNRLNATKSLLDTQEKIYTEKKSQGFLVQETWDSIKSAKNKVQETEQQILTNKLAEADVNLNLLQSSITDIRENLQDAVKQEQTALGWIKDNAVAVAAVIAALGTISGFAIKASKSVKTGASKLTETVKQKVNNKPGESNHHQTNNEAVKETDKKA